MKGIKLKEITVLEMFYAQGSINNISKYFNSTKKTVSEIKRKIIKGYLLNNITDIKFDSTYGYATYNGGVIKFRLLKIENNTQQIGDKLFSHKRKIIDINPKYTIDTRGMIYNTALKKYIKSYKTKGGGLWVDLYNNGKHRGYYVHNLVAKAFISNPKNKREVIHKNGIKDDNRVENLKWGEKKSNEKKWGLLDKKFYVYAILDPTKKGKYLYNDIGAIFLYEPFYIGKGTGRRMLSHLDAKSIEMKDSLKNKRIRKIIKSGDKPILYIIEDKLVSDDALKRETEIIKAIGRQNNNTGVLTNITRGGELGHIAKLDKTPIKKIDPVTKKVIERFKSIEEAVLKTGIRKQEIVKSASKKLQKVGGFIWRLVGDSDFSNIDTQKKKIDVYDINMKYIETCESIRNTSKKYKTKCVSGCCKGATKQSRGFIFRFNDKEFREKYQEINKNKKPVIIIRPEPKKVCQVLKNGKLIIYSSMYDAEKKLKISHSVIRANCKNKYFHPKNKYILYFYEDYLNGVRKIDRPPHKISIVGIHIRTDEKIEFSFVSDIEKSKFNYEGIRRCIRGERKQHKNYKWYEN